MLISLGNRPPQNFSAHFLEEIGRHKLFRLISLRKSAATKLFRLISSGNRPLTCSLISSGNRPLTYSLISSGNRPPQNFFSSFPQEIGRHKLFRLISSGNRPPQNFSAHFLRKSLGWAFTHFLRKSMDGLPLISSGNRWMGYIELDVILTFLRRTHVSVDAHGKAPF